jgi:hypothetical protein
MLPYNFRPWRRADPLFSLVIRRDNVYATFSGERGVPAHRWKSVANKARMFSASQARRTRVHFD